jgi:membrane-associated phospholipid phosphatase
MGLAVALASYYPRGRYVFYALAGATAVSRVIAPSHYVSDTLAGLALGIVIGKAVVRSAHWAPDARNGHTTSLHAARLTDVPGTRGEKSSSELVKLGL